MPQYSRVMCRYEFRLKTQGRVLTNPTTYDYILNMILEKNSGPLRTAITDRTYDFLRALVLDSELAPGEKLKIDHLSQRLKVSQTPIREALNRLSAEGLVVQKAYRGFQVSELLDPVELTQLQAAREVIEVAAISSIRLPDVGFALPILTALVDEMDAHAREPLLNLKAFNAADAEFHRLAVSISKNRFLLEAFDALHVHVQIARHYQGKSVEQARSSNQEHRNLLNLLGQGDIAGASDVALQHIRKVSDRLIFSPEIKKIAT